MKIHKDLKEFIELLNSNGVEYVVVGGHAVAYHGHPRFTGDMDFFVKASEENAAKIVRVLHSFGFKDTAGLKEHLLQAGKVVQLGRPPNRIDLLSGISGVSFERAIATSVVSELDGVRVPFIGFEALIENKAASGRPKDQADIHELKKARSKQG